MDELGTNDWFKLDIDHLTLPNAVKALTHGNLPSALDSKWFVIGIQK